MTKLRPLPHSINSGVHDVEVRDLIEVSTIRVPPGTGGAHHVEGEEPGLPGIELGRLRLSE